MWAEKCLTVSEKQLVSEKIRKFTDASEFSNACFGATKLFESFVSRVGMNNHNDRRIFFSICFGVQSSRQIVWAEMRCDKRYSIKKS